MRHWLFLTAGLLLAQFPFSGAAAAQSWKVLTSGTDSNLRGLSAVQNNHDGHITLWACGSHGVVLRSSDDGATWERRSVPGRAEADFRGIVAISDSVAYLMASGDGENSGIFKTLDGGRTWQTQFTLPDRAFFLDSIACLSESFCMALGDPMDGKFVVLKTSDGTRWSVAPKAERPAAVAKEGAFAASNSNLQLVSEKEYFLVTGGFTARVLHTANGGKTWSAARVPLAADNASSGAFGMARAKRGNLVVVGGDYAQPEAGLRAAAVSEDGGGIWRLATQQPAGFRSAVVASDDALFVAVGSNGSDISRDGGAHWSRFDGPPLNALFALDREHVWGAGPKGTITQFVPNPVAAQPAH